jgi:hypothetical protein
MRARIIVLILAWWGMGLGPAPAQVAHPFSQPYNWQKRSTSHFSLYFPAGLDESAERVLRYAEQVRYDLGLLFDYKPQGPHTLVYLPHGEAALYSSLNLGGDDTPSGYLHLPDHYGLVIHPGTTAELYQEVRRQVARVLLMELNYGYSLGSVARTSLLYYDADWFTEGLADFVGYGWNYEDEQVIKTLTAYQMLELAQEGQGYLNRIVRRSIWYFVTHEYGMQKLREIIYLANISNSIESGIISVLGITLSSLTDRWQEYFQGRFRQQAKGRMRLAEEKDAIHLPLRKGARVSTFAQHAPSERIAVYFNQEGQQTLYIYDQEGRQYRETPIQTGLTRIEGDILNINPPLAWSHDGQTIATTVYDRNGYQLVFYDVASGEVSYEALPDDVEAITHIAWAYQDDRLAYAIRAGGRSDIWVGTRGSVQFRRLTNDAFDDLEPSWSLDDQFIFFSSNRDTALLQVTGKQWASYKASFDLFKLKMSRDSLGLVRLTRTPNVNERAPQPVSSFEVIYRSDASGIPNLRKLNIFGLQGEPLTDLFVGVSAFEAHEQQVLIRQPQQAQSLLYVASQSALEAVRAPKPTLLRLARDAAYDQRVKQLARQAEAEAQSAPLPAPDSTAVEPTEPAVAQDSTQQPTQPADKSQEPVRYYIFDEEDEPYEVRKPTTQPQPRSNRSRNKPARLVDNIFGEESRPGLEEVKVGRSTGAGVPWQNDYLGINLVYDPFARLGAQFDVGFSDLFDRHRVQLSYTPFFNIQNFLRNHFFDLEYAYRANRLDWFGQMGFITRHQREASNLNNQVARDSTIFRFNQIHAQLGARYALSAFAEGEVSVGYYHINRVDQKLLREQRIENADQLVRAGALLRYDRVERSQSYAVRGLSARASFDSYYSLANQDFAFHRAMGEVRYYRPLYEKVVLALRVAGAFNFPREVEQYYLGGVDGRLMMLTQGQGNMEQNFVDPRLDSGLYRTHFLGLATPIRGFRNAVRAGSRYLMSNIELRIPVSRLLKQSLSSSRLYNLELIPFLDVGAVWVEGNPFSQKKPTDTQYIPLGSQGPFAIKLQTLKSPFLIGFGSGARINLLSWSLRADIAWGVDDYVVQRPTLTLSMGRSF